MQDGSAIRALSVAEETRLRGVLDAIFAFVGLFSADGIVLDSNEAPLAAGGLARDAVVGHRFVDLPWFAHSEVERARIGEAIARAARGEASRLETTIQSRAGGLVYIDAAFAPLHGDGGVTHVVGTGVDVTVRRRAERALAEAMRHADTARAEAEAARDQLRALASRLSDVREEERREIARELHDQVGQALTSLKLDLGGLAGQLEGEAARARLAAMNGLVDATLDTTRRLSASLRPAILDDLGLSAAIRWQAREFAERTGVPCDAEVPGEGAPVAPAAALGLFRILQEALTNVARHAAARRVRVALRVEDGQATLVIGDDGRGLSPDVLARPTSLGIVGMRERALALAGEIAISGAEGHGTTVTVRVPAQA